MLRTIASARAASMRLSSPLTIRSSLKQTRIPNGAPIRAFTQRCTPKPGTAKSAPGTGFTFSSNARPAPPSNILQRLRNLNTRFLHSTKARRSDAATPTPEPTTLSGKLGKLFREYGWSATAVYVFLSLADYPFCYMIVLAAGPERVGYYEHLVISNVKKAIPQSVKTFWNEWRASMKKAETDITGDQKISEGVEMAGWGVEEAQEKDNAEASVATKMVLAYAIHKAFIFVRIPLCLAITPKFVKFLRGRGWDIGKRTSKETKAINREVREKIRASKPKRKLPFSRRKKPDV